ncbi:hypothetical protein [Variovorax sp. V15]|uniref:hypothetical protein n=1 Tax=Variovorax sp. V15 TaxID=3065952 RepID=UPI0034E88A9F
MSAITGLFGLLPGWLWAGLVAASVLHGCWVGHKRDGAVNSLHDLQASVARNDADRALAALADLQRVVALSAAHAKDQQEKVDEFDTAMQTVQAGRDADRRDAERVRQQFAAYRARDRDEPSTDPAACQRVKDRSERLAGLAERGRELLAGGRRLVEQRDAEVSVLLGVVRNDRQLIAPVQTSAQTTGEDAEHP